MDELIAGRPALTPEGRRHITRLCKQVAAVFQHDNTDPQMAIVVLLNVQASIIASRFPDGHTEQEAQIARMIPLYVGTYMNKERQILG